MTDPVAPAAAPAAPIAPAGAPAAAPAWYDNFSNPELKGWVQAAGVPDPEQAAAKAWNLEKMLGADRAGRTVVLPSDANAGDPKAWEPVYEKLGRPASADLYKLDMPEGADPAFAKTAATWFHSAGLTQTQAQNVAKAWNEYAAHAVAAQTQAEETALAAEHAALAKDWGTGPAADAQREMGRRAAVKLGLDEQSVAALEKVVGFSKVMKAFAKMGELLGEGKTEGIGEGGSFAITPEAAVAQRQRLMADKEFGKRYMAGDVQAIDQMRKLDEVIAASKAQQAG